MTPQRINVYNNAPTWHKKTFSLRQGGAAVISGERPELFFLFKTNMRSGCLNTSLEG